MQSALKHITIIKKLNITLIQYKGNYITINLQYYITTLHYGLERGFGYRVVFSDVLNEFSELTERKCFGRRFQHFGPVLAKPLEPTLVREWGALRRTAESDWDLRL